jgi:acetyl esterase/lipase
MTIDSDADAFVRQAKARPSPSPAEMTIDEYRAGAHAMVALGFEPEQMEAVDELVAGSPGSAGIPLRVYRPTAAAKAPVVVWVHGGSWVRGDLATHDSLLRYVAKHSGCVVVGVAQRLAPEAGYAEQLADVRNAASWVRAHAAEIGGDPDLTGIAGDSSGANLVAATVLQASLRFALQVLIVPALDLTMNSNSWDQFDGEYLISREQMRWALGHYAPGADLTDPELSPLFAPDVAGLPPTLVFTAEYDPLRDDGERYAAKLADAGVPVTLRRFDGLIHHAVLAPKVIPAARAAMLDVASSIASALSREVPRGTER